MKIEDAPGSYKLLHVGSELTFAQLPELQQALANGIRSRQLFWCLDCSDASKFSAAVTAILVAVAGGLRTVGGDLVVFRAQGSVDGPLAELRLGTFLRVISSLNSLAAGQYTRVTRLGKREEMEDALLLYRGERDKERVRREDVPLTIGTAVVLYDGSRRAYKGRIVDVTARDGTQMEITAGDLELAPWNGALERNAVISVRFSDGQFVYDNYGTGVRGREDSDKVVIAAPPFFLKSDQRLHDRVDVNLPAMVLPCDLATLRPPYSARIVNLSLSGCALQVDSDEMPPAGALLSLSFMEIELSGKVARHVDDACAVGFFDMDFTTKRMLTKLVRTLGEY